MAEANNNPPTTSSPPPVIKEIIPIDPSQLKIEKHGGKKTSSIFCLRPSFSHPGKATPIHSPRHSVPRLDLSELNDSGLSSVHNCNLLSDTMSVVSDISDLSTMSYYSMFNSLVTSNKRACNNNSPNSSSKLLG